jgi:ankyrin repeat protein
VIKLLIQQGADLNVTTKWSHGTPLIIALQSGHDDIAEVLITTGADITVRDPNGGTALHAASVAGNLKWVKYLVEHGLSIGDAKVPCAGAPLVCAALGDHPDVMEYLLSKGADIEQKDDSGGTALVAAASCGHLKSVEFLVGKGADVNARNSWMSALQFCEKRHFDDVAKFLKSHGAKESN